MRSAVIFDIDGTLANCEHRMHFVKPEEGQKKNWGAFFKEAKKDEVVEHVQLLNALLADGSTYEVFIVTGRPVDMEDATRTWLDENRICYDALFMRPKNEFKKDYEVKRDVLNMLRKDGYQVKMVFEDKLDVCEMWRQEGIPVLVCGDAWRKIE